MVFVLLPIVFIAVAGLAYVWLLTFREVRAAKAFGRPQTIRLVGLLASTALAPLPYLMVFFVDPHNQKYLAWSMKFAVLLFLLSLPGAFLRKGLIRWGLVLSSIFFLGFTAFIYLISGWQF
jgi:hypothetical protein